MNSSVRHKRDIMDLLLSNRKRLRELGARRLGLFGSFARNQQVPTSDIDLLVEFEHGKKNYDNFIKLAYYLEELLKRRVELVTSSSISPYIKPYIQEEIEYITLGA